MNNKYIAVGVIVVVIIAAIGIYALSGDNDDDTPTVRVSGSTTVEPIMAHVAEVFGDVRIEVSAGGSGAGANQCISGQNDIGMLSRDPTQSEIASGLVPVAIAYDAVAVIIDDDAGVSNLTLRQLAMIYAGEITNWNEVGGNDLEINPIVRAAGSGTRDCFNETLESVYEVDYDTVMTSFRTASSNGNMSQQVATTVGAIGYVGLGFLPQIDAGAVEISIDGIHASVETTIDGTYEITRSLILVTNGEPSDSEQAVIDYILSADGQAIVEEHGYIPIN